MSGGKLTFIQFKSGFLNNNEKKSQNIIVNSKNLNMEAQVILKYFPKKTLYENSKIYCLVKNFVSKSIFLF